MTHRLVDDIDMATAQRGPAELPVGRSKRRGVDPEQGERWQDVWEGTKFMAFASASRVSIPDLTSIFPSAEARRGESWSEPGSLAQLLFHDHTIHGARMVPFVDLKTADALRRTGCVISIVT